MLQQRAILRRALNVAVQDDIIARNPVTGTRVRSADVEEVRPLDPGQVGALVGAGISRWMIYELIRPGELDDGTRLAHGKDDDAAG